MQHKIVAINESKACFTVLSGFGACLAIQDALAILMKAHSPWTSCPAIGRFQRPAT
jgi:hypothetical protein